jgi:hypothetical protein
MRRHLPKRRGRAVTHVSHVSDFPSPSTAYIYPLKVQSYLIVLAVTRAREKGSKGRGGKCRITDITDTTDAVLVLSPFLVA